MVGVWDTVGALGIPRFNIPGISRSTFDWHHTGLRIPIEHGFHAIAIDEHRPPFKATLWTVRHGIKAKPRDLSSVEQRWFVGAHANVGGGYSNDLLGQPSLKWMAAKAKKLGLELRYEISLDGDTHKAKINDSHTAFLKGIYAKVVKRNFRIIGADPWMDGISNSHSTVNETIDSSVFDRWNADESYRPQNLAEWAGRKKIILQDLRGSVSAQDGSSVTD